MKEILILKVSLSYVRNRSWNRNLTTENKKSKLNRNRNRAYKTRFRNCLQDTGFYTSLSCCFFATRTIRTFLNIFEFRCIFFVPFMYIVYNRQVRRKQIKGRCITDPSYDEVNNCFERSLVFMHKMPRIWIGRRRQNLTERQLLCVSNCKLKINK